ncbi:MAG: hypothetical protein KIT45_12095 [Fimbriimonadia bacterium]|nr:hypothetical protein [Fimbriimonadia bacterium]
MSKRIVIDLDDSDAEHLEQQARQEGQSLSEWVQQLIKNHTTSQTHTLGEFEIVSLPASARRCRYRVLRQGTEIQLDPQLLVGCIASGLGDLSTDHDRYLAEAFE